MRFTKQPYAMTEQELIQHIDELSDFIKEFAEGDLTTLHILTQRRYRCQKELERRKMPMPEQLTLRLE